MEDREAYNTTGTLTAPVAPEMRRYWLQRREALLIELRAIEDLLGMERTLTNRQAKEQGGFRANSTV